MRKLAVPLLILALLTIPALADSPPETDEAPLQDQQAETREEERTRHPILFYLPNRVFDLLDLARARGRLGPGIGLSARATKPLSASAGTDASVFVGLPGPRGEPKVSLPVGMENYAGADASVFAVSTECLGPSYGLAEVGPACT